VLHCPREVQSRKLQDPGHNLAGINFLSINLSLELGVDPVFRGFCIVTEAWITEADDAQVANRIESGV
jgi:hypothetical protein